VKRLPVEPASPDPPGVQGSFRVFHRALGSLQAQDPTGVSFGDFPVLVLYAPGIREDVRLLSWTFLPLQGLVRVSTFRFPARQAARSWPENLPGLSYSSAPAEERTFSVGLPRPTRARP